MTEHTPVWLVNSFIYLAAAVNPPEARAYRGRTAMPARVYKGMETVTTPRIWVPGVRV